MFCDSGELVMAVVVFIPIRMKASRHTEGQVRSRGPEYSQVSAATMTITEIVIRWHSEVLSNNSKSAVLCDPA